MGDTNYIGSIVKILETPRQEFNENNIAITKLRAQIPQIRNNRMINLIFWGNLANDIANYYKTNDYIIVEGYVSISNQQFSEKNKMKIAVSRIYPFILSGDTFNSKI